jgi:hypothetical protein
MVALCFLVKEVGHLLSIRSPSVADKFAPDTFVKAITLLGLVKRDNGGAVEDLREAMPRRPTAAIRLLSPRRRAIW